MLAQYSDAVAINDLGGPQEFVRRRQELAKQLKTGYLILFARMVLPEAAHPSVLEYQIEPRADYVFRDGGAEGWAYPAIVSSGDNINTWHYFNDRCQIQSNELVVFDFAADLHHMAMDITRTFNVSGKFTPEQAKWYAVDPE